MLIILEFNNKKVVRQQLAQPLENVKKVRLVKLIYTVSWSNITDDNNSITYGTSNSSLPVGLYNVPQIQRVFTKSSMNVTIALNQPTGCVVITTDKLLRLGFSSILGFPPNYTISGDTYPVTVTGNIPSLLFKTINITLKEINSYHNMKNDTNSNILYSFKNSNAFFGDTVENEPDKKIFLNLNSNVLTHLEIGAVDNFGNDILANNIYFQVVLEII